MQERRPTWWELLETTEASFMAQAPEVREVMKRDYFRRHPKGARVENAHSHYIKDVSRLEKLDVYRLLELFDVACPVMQHIVKKALVAGKRGHKDQRRDVQDILDSAVRKLEMMDEDERGGK